MVRTKEDHTATEKMIKFYELSIFEDGKISVLVKTFGENLMLVGWKISEVMEHEHWCNGIRV
jgi:hypothetical protein